MNMGLWNGGLEPEDRQPSEENSMNVMGTDENPEEASGAYKAFRIGQMVLSGSIGALESFYTQARYQRDINDLRSKIYMLTAEIASLNRSKENK